MEGNGGTNARSRTTESREPDPRVIADLVRHLSISPEDASAFAKSGVTRASREEIAQRDVLALATELVSRLAHPERTTRHPSGRGPRGPQANSKRRRQQTLALRLGLENTFIDLDVLRGACVVAGIYSAPNFTQNMKKDRLLFREVEDHSGKKVGWQLTEQGLVAARCLPAMGPSLTAPMRSTPTLQGHEPAVALLPPSPSTAVVVETPVAGSGAGPAAPPSPLAHADTEALTTLVVEENARVQEDLARLASRLAALERPGAHEDMGARSAVELLEARVAALESSRATTTPAPVEDWNPEGDAHPLRGALRTVLRRMIRAKKIGRSLTPLETVLHGPRPHERGAIATAVEALVAEQVLHGERTRKGKQVSIEVSRLQEVERFVATGEIPWSGVARALGV